VPKLKGFPSNPNAQRWHRSNKDRTGKCCSGLRAWNTDQCVAGISNRKSFATHVCTVEYSPVQHIELTADDEDLVAGQLSTPRGCVIASIKKGDSYGFTVSQCFYVDGVELPPMWKKRNVEVPVETRLYQKALKDHPEMFA